MFQVQICMNTVIDFSIETEKNRRPVTRTKGPKQMKQERKQERKTKRMRGISGRGRINCRQMNTAKSYILSGTKIKRFYRKK